MLDSSIEKYISVAASKEKYFLRMLLYVFLKDSCEDYLFWKWKYYLCAFYISYRDAILKRNEMLRNFFSVNVSKESISSQK